MNFYTCIIQSNNFLKLINSRPMIGRVRQLKTYYVQVFDQEKNILIKLISFFSSVSGEFLSYIQTIFSGCFNKTSLIIKLFTVFVIVSDKCRETGGYLLYRWSKKETEILMGIKNPETIGVIYFFIAAVVPCRCCYQLLYPFS